jgi:hypothetical protein
MGNGTQLFCLSTGFRPVLAELRAARAGDLGFRTQAIGFSGTGRAPGRHHQKLPSSALARQRTFGALARSRKLEVTNTTLYSWDPRDESRVIFYLSLAPPSAVVEGSPGRAGARGSSGPAGCCTRAPPATARGPALPAPPAPRRSCWPLLRLVLPPVSFIG